MGIETRILPKENLAKIISSTPVLQEKDVEFFLYDVKENNKVVNKGCYGRRHNNKEEITPIIEIEYPEYNGLFDLILKNSKKVSISDVRDIETFINRHFS